MLGLCHVCFTSNVTISMAKGIVYCVNCNAEKKEKKEEKIKIRLEFEDLPLGNLKQRSNYAYEIVKQLYDKD